MAVAGEVARGEGDHGDVGGGDHGQHHGRQHEEVGVLEGAVPDEDPAEVQQKVDRQRDRHGWGQNLGVQI